MNINKRVSRSNLVRTKPYRLTKQKYMWIACKNILFKQWWILSLFTLLTASLYFYFQQYRWLIFAGIIFLMYIIFWLSQVYIATLTEENAFFFEKLTYEISPQGITVFVTKRYGMPIEWKQFSYARNNSQGLFLFISIIQFIYLPKHIMHSADIARVNRWIIDKKLA